MEEHLVNRWTVAFRGQRRRGENDSRLPLPSSIPPLLMPLTLLFTEPASRLSSRFHLLSPCHFQSANHHGYCPTGSATGPPRHPRYCPPSSPAPRKRFQSIPRVTSPAACQTGRTVATGTGFVSFGHKGMSVTSIPIGWLGTVRSVCLPCLSIA